MFRIRVEGVGGVCGGVPVKVHGCWRKIIAEACLLVGVFYVAI